MGLFDRLTEALEKEYDTVRVLKQSERGTVSVVRHRESGRRFVFRLFDGNGAVYRKLLAVSNPHLPRH